MPSARPSDDVVAVVEDILRQEESLDDASLFGRIVAAWAAEPENTRNRGIALDVALIHIASMSNLMAALGWALVDLIEHPEQARQVASGDRDLAQRCALESTRMAQRSIMSRAVLAPVTFDAGDAIVDVPAGWTIATLLPLLNTSAAPGLDRWDPKRWHRHRLADAGALPSPMLVTAFGHGRHSCPAQPFSLSAMTAAMTRLLARYELTPGWTGAPAAGARTDRRRGTRGRPVPSVLRAALTAGEPGNGTHLTAHCGRVGIGKDVAPIFCSCP